VIRMQGRDVYRHAVRRMVESSRRVLADARISPDEIDLLVAHQANIRIIEATALELGIPAERVFVNVDRVANTSAASIPIALHDAERSGRLFPGARVALAAFGAGFVWAAGVISWKERAHVYA
jgi:3-oxoacyl-[acyl-carrier-protein] synthase-3